MVDFSPSSSSSSGAAVPAPPRMMGTFAKPHLTFSESAGFLTALENFEQRCEEANEELVVVLGGKAEHNQDGQCWMMKGYESNVQVFGCTVNACCAQKRVQTLGTGASQVTYSGPHSHKRPQLSVRGQVKDEGSTSGSRGSLGDVYALLTRDMDM